LLEHQRVSIEFDPCEPLAIDYDLQGEVSYLSKPDDLISDDPQLRTAQSSQIKEDHQDFFARSVKSEVSLEFEVDLDSGAKVLLIFKCFVE